MLKFAKMLKRTSTPVKIALGNLNLEDHLKEGPQKRGYKNHRSYKASNNR